MTNLSSHIINSINITDCVSSTFVKVLDQTISQRNMIHAIFSVNSFALTSVIDAMEQERYYISVLIILSREDYALRSNKCWWELCAYRRRKRRKKTIVVHQVESRLRFKLILTIHFSRISLVATRNNGMKDR